MDLIRSLSWISASHLRLARDDDSYVDRLSHRYTVAICVLFAIIVTTKQYAGDPIDCWVPAQFKASYEKYADSYCWITGSYYAPMEKELPLNERDRRQHKIRYYQWVPFLLLFQAILCYAPRVIWRSLSIRSGLDLVNLVDAAIKYESVEKFCDREKIMSYIVGNIERYVGANRKHYEVIYRNYCSRIKKKDQIDVSNKTIKSKSETVMLDEKGNSEKFTSCWCKLSLIISAICFCNGKRLGNFLVILYMFVKTLWVSNAISQLFLLNRFIGNDYHAFGFEVIDMLLNGQEWHELKHFPRVTYCDFKIREIGQNHDWTVQCVLRINLFNEVIYIFMWFWLCILAICGVIDYFNWILNFLISKNKLRFVKNHLNICNNIEFLQISQKQDRNTIDSELGNDEFFDINKEKELMRKFTFNYLKDDGIFALRILASNTSDLVVNEIINELWKTFKLNEKQSSNVAFKYNNNDVGSYSNKSKTFSPNSSNLKLSVHEKNRKVDTTHEIMNQTNMTNLYMLDEKNLKQFSK